MGICVISNRLGEGCSLGSISYRRRPGNEGFGLPNAALEAVSGHLGRDRPPFVVGPEMVSARV